MTTTPRRCRASATEPCSAGCRAPVLDRDTLSVLHRLHGSVQKLETELARLLAGADAAHSVPGYSVERAILDLLPEVAAHDTGAQYYLNISRALVVMLVPAMRQAGVPLTKAWFLAVLGSPQGLQLLVRLLPAGSSGALELEAFLDAFRTRAGFDAHKFAAHAAMLYAQLADLSETHSIFEDTQP
jgi:hypothetical protein